MGEDVKVGSQSQSEIRTCSRCGAPLPPGADDPRCAPCASKMSSKLSDEPSGEESGPSIGGRIGPYRILEKIGEGGFATVWAVEQLEPVRRRAALKLLKSGTDNSQIALRFEVEREALAMMDHSNIAHVFDAGRMETGRPYFVMELVKGVKITDYCRFNNTGIKERLELFVTVCQAIQHAHQKGIIHRDIKPSNVLVALNEGLALPKVIDFGIAKALEGRISVTTPYTLRHQLIGTPAYMSPEQAQMTHLDIDTRSDIYSLGVLLYELLTGSPPFDPERLGTVSIDEMRRIIIEEEPVRPSTRLARNREGVASKGRDVSTSGSTPTSARAITEVRGDLDWITMKCLEKDRTRRYETANALVMDIRRFLNMEPVLARPPSTGYRLWKSIRRNKAAYTAGSVLSVALLAGLLTSTWFWRRESEARNLAVAAARAARTAQSKESDERRRAEQRLYEGLVREARAIRLARRVGYRDSVFALLERARNLAGATVDTAELRREAVACFGDFVGHSPLPPLAFPENTRVQRIVVDPSDQFIGALLWDWRKPATSDDAREGQHGILIYEIQSGREIADLSGDSHAVDIAFFEDSSGLVSLHFPKAAAGNVVADGATLSTWTGGANRPWRRVEERRTPGTLRLLRSDKGVKLLRRVSDEVLELADIRTNLPLVRIPNAAFSPADPVALSMDGETCAFPGSNGRGEVEIWSVQAGTLVGRLRADLGGFDLIGLALSSNGQFLSCMSQGSCAVYNLREGKHVATLQHFFRPQTEVAFLPQTGVLTIPLNSQRRVHIWDTLRGETLADLDVPGEVDVSAISPAGTVIAAFSGQNAWPFKLTSNGELSHMPRQSRSVPGVGFSPDGKHLATACMDQRLRVWDLATSTLVWESSPLAAGVESVAYSPDGRFLASTTWSVQSVWIWDARTGERVMELGATRGGYSWSVRFSPDGRHLVAALGSDGLAVWKLDLSPGDRSAPSSGSATLVKRLEGDVIEADFLADGRRVVYRTMGHGGQGAAQFVWDTTSDDPPRVLSVSTAPGFQSQSLTRDRTLLMTVMSDGLCVLARPDTGETRTLLSAELVGALGGIMFDINSSISPDGSKAAATIGSRREVRVFSTSDGKMLFELPADNGAVEQLAWSSDGTRLAITRENGEVAVWNFQEVDRVLRRLGLSH
ncbi:MAG: protein kinase [Verrucomicrobiales bacterium]|nr:protein kinase [Verrucomicrobiales bacterium]